jgi:hypothetical protein
VNSRLSVIILCDTLRNDDKLLLIVSLYHSDILNMYNPMGVTTHEHNIIFCYRNHDCVIVCCNMLYLIYG